MNRHKNITRMDQGHTNTHGWLVRIGYLGGYHRKFFSDARNGDRQKALEKAIAYRDITIPYLKQKSKLERDTG